MLFLSAQDQLLADLQDDSTENRPRAKDWLNRSMRRIIVKNKNWSWTQDIVQRTELLGVSSVLVSDIDPLMKGVGQIYNRDEDSHIVLIHHLDFFSCWPVPEDEDSGSPEIATIKTTVEGGVPVERVYFNKPFAQNTALDYKISIKIADLSADGDTPPWDSDWDYVWLLGAMYYGLQFNDDQETARTALSDFSREVTLMRSMDTSMFLTDGIRFQTPSDSARLLGKAIYPARWIWIGNA